ncbi:MAG: YraN family protein [Brevinema sp.]
MLLNNNSLGKIGEQKAKKYLIDKGFEFITENYFTPKGEIDLIFKEKEILIFVEVKTRKNKKHLETAFGFQKVKHLRASAEIFIEKEDISFIEMRFDVIFILLDHEDTVVEIGHRPNFV